MKKISFVIPCYRSEKTIEGVISEIIFECQKEDFEYEIICVSDASPDNVMSVIRRLTEENSAILGIELAKNFGQHAAIMAGLRSATGSYIVCLDDDGQAPVDTLGKMVEKLEANNDVVYGKYQQKQHHVLRNIGSWVNDKMTEWLLQKPSHLYLSSFFIMKSFVKDEVISYDHSYPYLAGLILRATKHVSNLDVNHRARHDGRSGYTFAKLLGLWLNGFTAFSVKPLRFAIFLGLMFAFFGFCIAIYAVICKLLNSESPLGWASLISVFTITSGIILMVLGMIGEYVGRTYLCLNKQPQYVIRK